MVGLVVDHGWAVVDHSWACRGSGRDLATRQQRHQRPADVPGLDQSTLGPQLWIVVAQMRIQSVATKPRLLKGVWVL